MKLLTPGTGNQIENRRIAIEYISSNILDAIDIDFRSGNISTAEGATYHVSAYAESRAAFISTPGRDKSEYSIYASGLPSLMYRQIKNDKRTFIYEIDPDKVKTKPNSSSADWKDIDKAAKRIWVCTAKEVKCINRA